MFKDTPEGTTRHCPRCEMEAQMKEHPQHTCGIQVSNPTCVPGKLINKITIK